MFGGRRELKEKVQNPPPQQRNLTLRYIAFVETPPTTQVLAQKGQFQERNTIAYASIIQNMTLTY
jgi:hypothetical protein